MSGRGQKQRWTQWACLMATGSERVDKPTVMCVCLLAIVWSSECSMRWRLWWESISVSERPRMWQDVRKTWLHIITYAQPTCCFEKRVLKRKADNGLENTYQSNHMKVNLLCSLRENWISPLLQWDELHVAWLLGGHGPDMSWHKPTLTCARLQANVWTKCRVERYLQAFT